MKNIRHFLTAILLICSVCLTGQNIEKYYTSKYMGDGMLYFIKPMKIYQKGKSLCVFDQTIRPHTDSITFGMTLTNAQAFKVDSVVFSNGKTSIGKKAQHLFTEQSKRKWVSRVFVYLTHDEVRHFFSETPPVLTFYNSERTSIQISVKQKKWKKTLQTNRAVYDLIKMNEK